MKTNEAIGLGIMSGTSLDGIDLVLCKLVNLNKNWSYIILKSKTYKYNEYWKNKLAITHNLISIDILKLHKEYGFYLGNLVNTFIEGIPKKIDFIASHGHTVFHQPEKGITFQLGDGACITEKTKITTVSDFRNQDVILGGNGAPLVSIGDKQLFSNYEYCLNLGGFSNISHDVNNKRIAYDICPVNIIINHLSQKLDKEFDDKGMIARSGKIDSSLLNKLNNLSYYNEDPPKSLGREWLWNTFIPIIEDSKIITENILRTVYEHISDQISQSINNNKTGKVLITGGGAFNIFLVELIKSKTEHHIIIPDSEIIDFKEALIFAFLGLLKLRNEVNCLSSVTGACKDHSSGIIYDF